MELKYMMEKLGFPQTHIALKAMIKEVDEDLDNMISYKEFLLIFRYAKTGQLQSEGLKAIAANVNVDEVGVGGAKNFFETKARAINDTPAERDREYFAQRKAVAQEKAESKAAFKARASLFQ
jgi:EF-hand domain-containing family member D2